MPDAPTALPLADHWMWRRLMWFKWEAMWRLGLRTTDALGRPCRINLEAVALHAKTLPPPRDAEVFWSTIPRWLAGLVVALAALGVLGVVLGLVLRGVLGGDNGWAIGLVFSGAACVLLMVLSGVAAPFVRIVHARNRVLSACAAAKVCPNCRYSLEGLEPSGGVVACPECGFAWQAMLIPAGRADER